MRKRERKKARVRTGRGRGQDSVEKFLRVESKTDVILISARTGGESAFVEDQGTKE